jgi:hypothetical protein
MDMLGNTAVVVRNTCAREVLLLYQVLRAWTLSLST